MMDNMVWTEQLSVGNAVIDSEHRNLIILANDLIRAIKTRNSSCLAQAFEQLEYWLCLHFANEEKIAQTVSFDFSHHQLAQQYALNELRFLRDLLVTKNCLWFDGAINHFSRFLSNWMIDDHILKLDMRMKPVLQTLPYEFRIDEESACL